MQLILCYVLIVFWHGQTSLHPVVSSLYSYSVLFRCIHMTVLYASYIVGKLHSILLLRRFIIGGHFNQYKHWGGGGGQPIYRHRNVFMFIVVDAVNCA